LARWTHSGYPSCEERGRAVQMFKSTLCNDFYMVNVLGGGGGGEGEEEEEEEEG
jgi:hypothetical protein